MAFRINISVRLKITLGLIAIIIGCCIILAFLTGAYVNTFFVKEAQDRVNNNMKTANDIYEDYLGRTERTIKLISIHRTAGKTLEQDVSEDLNRTFENSYIKSRINILTFVDMQGNVLYRAHNPAVKGDNLSYLSIIRKALKEWTPHAGTIIIDADRLKNEGQDLQNRTVIKVIKTQNSMQTPKEVEQAGMFLAYAFPVTSPDGKEKLGVMLGCCLINNTTEIVDKIKSMVFQNQSMDGKDIGTATIFLDDVRVSTNVIQKDKTRAVGSRLSREVYEHVIQGGGMWADRAFVVNDWYITAYKPIRDPDGKIIGALYIGLLEEPFKHPRNMIMLFFLLATGITAIIMATGMFFYTKRMMRPIEYVVHISKKIMGGDMSARCKIRPAGEMGVLCSTIDQMADSLEQHMNKMKEETRKQIMQSEKLASVGRLAAGVAHEINNPLTGVLTFAHFLKDKKGNDEGDLHDINVIIQETTRVREIIRGLLDFARQSPPVKSMININEVIQQLLKLIKGQKEFKNITIVEEYEQKIPELLADKNQLQQVFLNLILNAGEAISGPGSITISTSYIDGNIVITFDDSGCGISEEDIDKIFDPFFTTKPVGKGTGLGLSVSYGIIQQHGGTIKCESRLHEGTTFLIVLPLSQNRQ
jgi:two-component system, NtrC family, sensor kinase